VRLFLRRICRSAGTAQITHSCSIVSTTLSTSFSLFPKEYQARGHAAQCLQDGAGCILLQWGRSVAGSLQFGSSPTPARSRSRSTRQTPRQTARKTPTHSRAASSLASSGPQISDSPFITLDSAHPANRMMSWTALFQPLAELPEAEGTSHAFQAIAEVPLSVRKPVRRNVSSMLLSEHMPANMSTDSAPRDSLRRASVATKVPAPGAETFPRRGKLSKNSILPAIAKASCETTTGRSVQQHLNCFLIGSPKLPRPVCSKTQSKDYISLLELRFRTCDPAWCA